MVLNVFLTPSLVTLYVVVFFNRLFLKKYKNVLGMCEA